MSNQQQAKKGLNKWLVTLLTVVVIGAFGATAYGMLKDSNPMTMYMMAQKNTMEEQFERMEEYSGDYMELYDRQMNEAYKADGTLKMDVQVQGQQIQQAVPQLGMIQGVLSTLQLNLNSKVNPETKEMYGSMDLTMQGNSIGNGNFYQNEETLAVQAPFVYDKYFAVPNDQFGAMIERTGEPAEGLQEFPNLVEASQNQFTFEETEEIFVDYVTTLGTELNEDQFSLSENATYEGEKYDQVTVEISEDEAQAMIVKVLEKLKDDERIWDKFEKQAELDQGVNGFEFNMEDMKTEIDSAINNIDSVKIPGGITIEAYLKDDLVAHQTWNMALQPENEEKVTFEIATDYLKEDKDRYTSSVNMNVTPESEEGTFTLRYEEVGKPNKDGLHVDYTIGLQSDFQPDPFTAEIVLNTDYTEEGSKTNFDVQLDGEAFAQQPVPSISGFLNMTTKDKDDDTVNRKTDLGLNVAMNDPAMGDMSADLEFNMDQTITFTDDLSFPELKEDNTVYVMDKSDQEMIQIAQEVQLNFQKHIGSLLGGFGGLGGF